jgi:hypothetical protein
MAKKKDEAVEGEIVEEKDDSLEREKRRAKLKRKARHRAMLNLQITDLRIDYVLDVIEPDMEEFDKEIASGKLPEYKKMVLVPETPALEQGQDA